MSKQTTLGIVAVLVLLIGLFIYITRLSGNPEVQPPSTPPPTPLNFQIDPALLNANWQNLIANADGPAEGNQNAPYTMIEIGDFQCPMCGKLHGAVENFVNESGGQLKLYFINFPLIHIHPHAQFAAEAALAASKQGKFWQMYNLLYAHQDELIPSIVEYYSGQDIPGFDLARYKIDVASPTIVQRVNDQAQFVESLKVISTPTFLLRRTGGGEPAWFVGANDTQTSLGFNHLAQAPPWMNGGTIPTLHGQ